MTARTANLARRRAAMGFTQESLAEHWGLERSTVGRWERGAGTPQPWNQPDLAKALDVSLDTLIDLLVPDPTDTHPLVVRTDVAHSAGAEFHWSDWLQTGHASVLDPPWSIAGTMQVLHEVAGGSMDRRGFLIVIGDALAGSGGQWSSSLAGARHPATVPHLPYDRLSAATLDRLDHRLADLRRLDDALGGRELHQLAVAEFRWLTCLADHAVYNSAAGGGSSAS